MSTPPATSTDEMIHYLDYAATSAKRPPQVARAIARFLEECGATPGRGGHRLALEAGRMVLDARRAVAGILGLGGDPGRVTFAPNATHGLNTALRGVLEPGDSVVVTQFDHNAVIRPVEALRREIGVEVRLVPGDREGAVDEAAWVRAVDGARVAVLNAASNVLGTRLPVERLAPLAREAGALVLVDAAQCAGHVPMDLSVADLVAFTGHKGLLGPQGTGGLWVRQDVAVRPLICGGTGGNSLDPTMPDHLPDRLEAGTLNGPGLAGLLAALEVIRAEGVASIHRREVALKARLREGMAGLPGVRVLSPPAPDGAGIVTLVTDRRNPAELAHTLDRDYGVMARAGLHCAPGAHQILGTTGTGALRLSVGWGSTEEDVDRAVDAVAEITRTTLIPTG